MAAPSKLTPEVRVKLFESAALDASVEEMAYYCNVSKVTIYQWMKDDEELSNEIARLRQKPILAARQAAVEKSTESYGNAMDFLKRKKKAEFGDNIDVTTDGEKVTGFNFIKNGTNDTAND